VPGASCQDDDDDHDDYDDEDWLSILCIAHNVCSAMDLAFGTCKVVGSALERFLTERR
jgi:hypothetical protein